MRFVDETLDHHHLTCKLVEILELYIYIYIN